MAGSNVRGTSVVHGVQREDSRLACQGPSGVLEQEAPWLLQVGAPLCCPAHWRDSS